ncbi:MAG TPA: efflux RND transporter periplasmic adaptor subunit [Geminicoccaceae bacterium]|nr:efflux RND transporter periplasmic adaptor subunit [Geminicoccaceae bacterium]
MRSPLAIAALFTLLLVGWLASRPLQELLAGNAGTAAAPAATAPIAPDPDDGPRMTVRVAESTARPVAPELVVNGHTEPARAVELKAETDGRVVATPVAEGSLVEAGTVVAALDLRDRESRVRQMEAVLAQRELEDEAARKLGAKQFQSETRVAEARAMLEMARAELHQARLDLAHTTIEAPFRGVVEERTVEVGDYVDPGDPVVMVIEQDPFLVVGDAPETMVDRFQPGEPGTAQLADGRTVEGKIRFVATQADPATRTFGVELEVANRDGRFPAGMSARIVVREPPVPAHRISAAALVLADDGTVGIKAVDAGGAVRFHPARIVKAETDAVWLGGLPEELRVITTGQGFVAEGEKVRVEVVPGAAETAARAAGVPS